MAFTRVVTLLYQCSTKALPTLTMVSGTPTLLLWYSMVLAGSGMVTGIVNPPPPPPLVFVAEVQLFKAVWELTTNLPAELTEKPEGAKLGDSCVRWTPSLRCRQECSSQCLFSTHPLVHVRLHQAQNPVGHLEVVLFL